MFQAGLPLGLWTGVAEMVVMVHEVVGVDVLAKLAIGERLARLAGIDAGLVQGQRVE